MHAGEKISQHKLLFDRGVGGHGYSYSILLINKSPQTRIVKPLQAWRMLFIQSLY